MKDIAEFITGFQRFRERYFQEDSRLFSKLREGQKPRTMVIACCDSRVDPAMLTDADPGDMFVVRNVANLVPPYRHGAEAPGIRAAIEFAVKGLSVEHIIVLGHSHCGGIQALLTDAHDEFIGAWVSVAGRARDKVRSEMPAAPAEQQARACEQEAIHVSLDNLMTFPWIRERVERRDLQLHGWYFDMDRGDMLGWSNEAGRFRSLAELRGKP